MTATPIVARCPFCGVGEGFPCKVAGRGRRGFFHPSRREKAQGARAAPAPQRLTKDWP
jgi:hypothetical protein